MSNVEAKDKNKRDKKLCHVTFTADENVVGLVLYICRPVFMLHKTQFHYSTSTERDREREREYCNCVRKIDP